MNLYNLTKNKLAQLKEKPFKLEREIQHFFEQNMLEITGLKLVKSEFVIKGKRIDTLAFDNQANAFVIIEYKRDKNVSVVDQGFTYLSLMLENKADFVLTYNETLTKSLHSTKVDWSQTRVIFVSPSFTENQRLATNFKDIAIELWEIKRFENDIISISPIKKTRAAESIKAITQQDSKIKSVTAEIRVYSEEEHLQGKSDDTVELYHTFKNAILNLKDDLDIKPKKQEIGFTNSGKIFADVCILKNSLKFWINLKKGQLDDPKKMSRDVTSIGHWGNGDYEIVTNDTNNIEYILFLIKQAL
ncbi:DUF5655 domain-containing protein [Flavobacterium phycosphaerae]|uniref:DUF5655 domain-containing protein n=1 Tax=Flavobacterium phycosphaerae TaxID=2697515 RepID=UPI00138A60A4|nr:DUF5655 domain-containing protein [Flavobacterium phycosphaerae]